MSFPTKPLKRYGFLLCLAFLAWVLNACLVSEEKKQVFIEVAKDSSWIAFDSLEIVWLESADAHVHRLFQGSPSELAATNPFQTEGYTGQPIHVLFRGFVSGKLISVVDQFFDSQLPTALILDTLVSPKGLDLSDLRLSSGELTPEFSPTESVYSVTVPSESTATVITAFLAVSSSRMQVNDNSLNSGEPSSPISLHPGLNTLALVVTGNQGETKTYTLQITRQLDENTDLTSLHFSAGRLRPDFDPNVLTYSLATDSLSTTVTSIVRNAASAIKVNGTTVASEKASPFFTLKLGDNSFDILVTAQNQATKVYQITATRAANRNADLADLVTSVGNVSPDFSAAETSYTLTVPHETTSARITATLASKTTSTLKINQMAASSGEPSDAIELGLGTNNLTVEVTAENGITRNYAIRIVREVLPMMSAGEFHSLFLKRDGTVWATGRNSFGQLGDSTTTDKSTPVQIMKGSTFQQIAAGANHSLFLKTDGTVWATGRNTYGGLGDSSTVQKIKPVPIMKGSTFTKVAAGYNHSLFIKTDGSLWATGYNYEGLLGDGTQGTATNKSAADKQYPVPIMKGATFSDIAAGSNHSLFLKTDGTLWVAGLNSRGQLGDSTFLNRAIPKQILPGHTFLQVAAGTYHSVFLESDGMPWTVGQNTEGQLGDSANANRNIPYPLRDITPVERIEAGFFHTFFLSAEGALWGTGQNSDGQLGDGTTTQRRFPIRLQATANLQEVKAGGSHSLFRTKDGSLFATGKNDFGQLGDGTTTSKPVPIPITP